MKSIFKQFEKWLVLLLFPAVGIFFLFHQTQRPKIKSKNDLEVVEGKIEDYSFKYVSGGKAISRQFYIWVKGYNCKFQIIADYLNYFEKSKFEKSKKNGDSIKIVIPSEDKDKLYKNEQIIVMSLSDNKNTYLSLKDTIAEEKKYFDIYAGILFLLIGSILIILSKKGIIRPR
ncbi:hypothetical protein [Flavobacterium aquidurense]|uniref:Uncharacterized protein n=1 Tax=Flavobacterium aquidurense TaxID=362413 RepID=A0A0Q0RW03_9FLAO|nr:hypothetical protein [Flavobacterium aquidurense]KQB41335.1 hypothetical protein RC62_4081 [Flavobacterium aquidurense]